MKSDSSKIISIHEWIDLIAPFWVKLPIQIVTDSKKRSKFSRDLHILLENFSLLLFFPQSVLGLSNLGSLFTLTKNINLMKATLYYFLSFSLGVIITVLSCCPVICAFSDVFEKYATEILTPKKKVPRNGASETAGHSNQKEKWFFINGIASSNYVADIQRQNLENLFGRSVELIYNPSHGLIFDSFESVLGRSFRNNSSQAFSAYKEIESAITSERYNKVVILSHSSGTLVVSDILNHISQFAFPDKVFRKLEVYTFGAVTDEMNDIEKLVYCEHFANQNDLFAQIGVLNKNINYQTERVFVSRRSGHLLMNNYLKNFQDQIYSSKSGYKPRLYSYIKK